MTFKYFHTDSLPFNVEAKTKYVQNKTLHAHSKVTFSHLKELQNAHNVESFPCICTESHIINGSYSRCMLGSLLLSIELIKEKKN